MPSCDRSRNNESEVHRLRRVLADRPCHVRSMARLAVLLHTSTCSAHAPTSAIIAEPSVVSSSSAEGLPSSGGSDGSSSKHSVIKKDIPESSSSSSPAGNDAALAADASEEASDLARRAVECRPDLPYGHWAMSMVAAEHGERMSHLRRAADRCDGVPHVLALARLLVEPRHDEASRIRTESSSRHGSSTTQRPTCQVGSASDEHPSRRPLTPSEEELYQRWNARLQALHKRYDESSSGSSNAAISRHELQSVAEREYGVGMMFRKMLPPSRYRERCIRHLKSSAFRFRQQNHPKAQLAQFWLSAVLGDDSEKCETSAREVTRCPPEYVVGLYATFAARFDSLLVDKLSYRTPDMLRQLVDATVGPRTYKSALDLGCGTGLSGLAFRSCVSDCFRGADLSPEMVETARQTRPGCYDELVVGDVLSQSTYEAANHINDDGDDHGSHRATRWDLIYACDVFVYLGDLSPVFAMVSKHLGEDEGVFAFSTELMHNDFEDEATEGPPYKLQSTGRFAHSVSYLNELAGTHHLCVRATTIRPIRKNAGNDVLGCLVVLSKAHTTSSS
jgi:predicted TPR repeat methyltransferase